MPRVLVVTYQWLPMFSAGVRQVANLCRYLPAAGWEPHILTKDWSDGAAPEDAPLGMSLQPIDGVPALKSAGSLPVVLAPYQLRDNRWMRWHARADAARAAHGPLSPHTWLRWALDATYPLYGDYPDQHRGWVEPAVAAGMAAVRQYGISAVVSVCPPATAHIVGGEIARRVGIPWVIHFADLGSFYQGPGDGRSRRERWESHTLAKQWLQGAARSACISPAMVSYVRATYGVSGEVVVMPFDPEERRVAPHRQEGAPLRLVHVAAIYPDDQRPEVLFDALDALLDAGSLASTDIVVEFVGSGCEGWLAERVQGRACESMIRITERVAPSEAVRMQREADVLLAFNHQRENTYTRDGTLRYPGTIFEQWNAGRPTIAVGPDHGGFLWQLLIDSGTGETADDAPMLAAALLRLRDELRDTGRIAFHGDETAIARYGAAEQARRLGGVLDAASFERFGSWQRAR